MLHKFTQMFAYFSLRIDDQYCALSVFTTCIRLMQLLITFPGSSFYWDTLWFSNGVIDCFWCWFSVTVSAEFVLYCFHFYYFYHTFLLFLSHMWDIQFQCFIVSSLLYSDALIDGVILYQLVNYCPGFSEFFRLLPVSYLIDTWMAKFKKKFVTNENVCSLFACNAQCSLYKIFLYSDDIVSSLVLLLTCF